MLYFHLYLGKIPILTHIFQMGWNHQLENHEPLKGHENVLTTEYKATF